MAGRTRFAVAVVVVCAVAAILLLLSLGFGRGGAPGGGPGETVSTATPTATPVARLGGWSLEVLSGESTLSFWGERLRLKVRCNNTGGEDWPVMPRQNFFLVLANGAEVRASDTDLWLGFYYVKRGESISFSVEFAVNGAEPAKLVYRERGKVMEVPLRGVKIERYRVVEVAVDLVSSQEPDVIASTSFDTSSEVVGSCGMGACRRYTANRAYCSCKLPLGARRTNMTLGLEVSPALMEVVVQKVEARAQFINISIITLSPRDPVTVKTRARITVVLDVEVPEFKEMLEAPVKMNILPIELVAYIAKKR